MTDEQKLYKEIAKLLKKYPEVEKAVLFGSRARGDFTERSDYDIAIYGKLERELRAIIRNAFTEDLPTLHKIDLIFMQEQKDEKFIQNIKKEGQTIYGKAAKQV